MKCVSLLSGGVDSTVALAFALEHGAEVDLSLSINYGQTHRRELIAAEAIAQHYGVEHREVDVSGALDIPCALTGVGIIPEEHAAEPDATFVPGRNLVLLALATSWADSWGYGAVILGANADDHNGYPDCRLEFIHAVDEAARSGYGVGIWTPLIRMDKRQIVCLGRELKVPLELTWSCYRGGSVPCENCGACESRKEGGL